MPCGVYTLFQSAAVGFAAAVATVVVEFWMRTRLESVGVPALHNLLVFFEGTRHHLITDVYSHKIVGWHLSNTLAVSSTLKALSMAISQAVEMRGIDSLKGLIHHSDRGVQYCCNEYVAML